MGNHDRKYVHIGSRDLPESKKPIKLSTSTVKAIAKTILSCDSYIHL